MFKKKTILAVITARGGSKGLAKKNIRIIGGKPLIAWTIEAAKNSKYLDRVILSSEDNEIISAARKWGCEVPFVRPKELSKDKTPGIDPVIHAVNSVGDIYDYIVLLQPTSPLRIAEDIDVCIVRCISGKYQSCVAVSEAEKPPFWMYLRNKKGTLVPLFRMRKMPDRRQDLPKVYSINGAVYVAERKWLLKTRSFIKGRTYSYVMPLARSLDVDTELDLVKIAAYRQFYGRQRKIL